MPFIGDGDAANVHAPVEEFYRFDRMRRRGYVNGENWRVGYYPVEYTPQHPLPPPPTVTARSASCTRRMR